MFFKAEFKSFKFFEHKGLFKFLWKHLHKNISYAHFWPHLCWRLHLCVYYCHHFICACLWDMVAKNKHYLQTILLVVRRRRCNWIQKKIVKANKVLDEANKCGRTWKWSFKLHSRHSSPHLAMKFCAMKLLYCTRHFLTEIISVFSLKAILKCQNFIYFIKLG